MNDTIERPEDPELTALRSFRAERREPSEEQERAARERLVSAAATSSPRRGPSSRAIAYVAAGGVAAAAAAAFVVPTLGTAPDAGPASGGTAVASDAEPETQITTTNDDGVTYVYDAPTPSLTAPTQLVSATASPPVPEEHKDEMPGVDPRVPQTDKQREMLETTRTWVHQLPDGRLRVDLPEVDGTQVESLNQALFEAKIPLQFHLQHPGEITTFTTTKAFWVETGLGKYMFSVYDAPVYDKDLIEVERVGGPGSQITSLTFPEVPTNIAQVEISAEDPGTEP